MNSRQEAQEEKPYALKRSDGYCESCGNYQPFILEAHHINSVKNGGSGHETNLAILCPNCHSIIEKLKTKTVDNPHFHDWIRQNYGEDGYNKFGRLAGFIWEE